MESRAPARQLSALADLVAEACSCECVERADSAAGGRLENVCVDHGGAHVAVAEKLLHSSDVRARLEQVSREAVAQCVGRDPFVDLCLLGSGLQCSGETLFIQVMSPDDPRARICGHGG